MTRLASPNPQSLDAAIGAMALALQGKEVAACFERLARKAARVNDADFVSEHLGSGINQSVNGFNRSRIASGLNSINSCLGSRDPASAGTRAAFETLLQLGFPVRGSGTVKGLLDAALHHVHSRAWMEEIHGRGLDLPGWVYRENLFRSAFGCAQYNAFYLRNGALAGQSKESLEASIARLHDDVDWMLSIGTDPNKLPDDGHYPLYLATAYDMTEPEQMKMTAILLRHGARTDQVMQGDGINARDIAAVLMTEPGFTPDFARLYMAHGESFLRDGKLLVEPGEIRCADTRALIMAMQAKTRANDMLSIAARKNGLAKRCN